MKKKTGYGSDPLKYKNSSATESNLNYPYTFFSGLLLELHQNTVLWVQ